MNTNYTIYCHRNKINNKAYIGQTCQKLDRRFRDGEGYKNCSYFYNAIQKYGWNNFEHIILFENLSQEEANIIEEKLISLFDTRNPEIGYNLDSGGNNRLHSLETKLKISNSLKRKMAGKNNPMFGKVSPNAKKVICLETQEIFSSATEAAKKYNIDHSLLSKVCRGVRKSAGKNPETGEPLHWKYI